MKKKMYNDAFYDARTDSLKSANHIVPIVMQLIKPKSVIDIGCGTGEFLSVFKKKGANQILGVDGEWVKRKKLRIPKEYFRVHDLDHPFEIDRKFDLVVCLEVAEHLPKKKAHTFVKTLTKLGEIILFSAAIPLQGGTNHLNEQWPEYWADLFKKEGFLCVDAIRKKIWDNEEVNFWYAQNTFFYVSEHYIHQNKALKTALEQTNESFLSLVHPKNYLSKSKQYDLEYLPQLLRWGVLKLCGLFRTLKKITKQKI